MTKPNQTPDARAYDALLESPVSFEVEDQQGRHVRLEMYPLQLGRLLEISKRLLALDAAFDASDQDAVKRMWQLCATHTRQVAELVAIATLRTREDLEAKLEQRVELLMWSPTMTVQAYTNLLFFIISQSYFADFTKAIRLVKTLRVQISPGTGANRIAATEDKASGDRSTE